MKTFELPSLVTMPKVKDMRGNLSFIEGGQVIPFEIERTYWLYDLPGGTERHGRALRTTYELVVAMSGCFDVTVISPNGRTNRFTLKRCDEGLILPPMTWRVIDNFSSGATILTLASAQFDENDYIRDFNNYKSIIGNE